MKKTLKLFVATISIMSLTQVKAGIEAFCFTDIYGYVTDVTATRTGPGYWELIGTADIGAATDWDIEGSYIKESDIWSLTFINTAPDGCTIYVDSFTYTSYSYGGGTINFTWESYCFGGINSTGTGSTTYTQGHCVFRMGERAPVGPMSADPEISGKPVADLHSIEGGIIFGDLFEEETLSVINYGDNIIGINYDLIENTNVEINIYNQMGQLLYTLVNEYKAEGFYTEKWNGADVSAGIYIVELKTGAGSISSKFKK